MCEVVYVYLHIVNASANANEDMYVMYQIYDVLYVVMLMLSVLMSLLMKKMKMKLSMMMYQLCPLVYHHLE